MTGNDDSVEVSCIAGSEDKGVEFAYVSSDRGIEVNCVASDKIVEVVEVY